LVSILVSAVKHYKKGGIMDLLAFIILVVWVGASLLFAYLAQELGLPFWMFLVIGIFGTPILALLAIAIIYGLRNSQNN
jgi:hypothetical protein